MLSSNNQIREFVIKTIPPDLIKVPIFKKIYDLDGSITYLLHYLGFSYFVEIGIHFISRGRNVQVYYYCY